MTENITLIGTVATVPRNVTTSSGLSITSFRLACTPRRFDKATNLWVDGDTNWFTISTFRQLAANTMASVNLGERLVVTGRLKIRNWQSGEKSGTSVEVDADALGHDLSLGYVKYAKGTAPLPARDDTVGEATGEPVGEFASVSAAMSNGVPDSVPDSWSVSPLGADDSTPF